ncbi:uncharacterized protein B0I36DRAFT_161371 [Microdochium trichocladiopsis]|uniref:Uncharacterized protein n=1 Tax=Microdochium trichocladiopsis TaxID=1682393 RepID=A0A9P8Y0Y9_9PEZI|nr:uncharacterized protein B0I36DRAFT_161371 [Microdochium trichocladiopsis]KAH7026703.1 hypothetical protein B0I36DRAFT_161371 [Microdochium trichocladiopsis]
MPRPAQTLLRAWLLQLSPRHPLPLMNEYLVSDQHLVRCCSLYMAKLYPLLIPSINLLARVSCPCPQKTVRLNARP